MINLSTNLMLKLEPLSQNNIARMMGVKTENLSTLDAAYKAADAIKNMFSDIGMQQDSITKIAMEDSL